MIRKIKCRKAGSGGLSHHFGLRTKPLADGIATAFAASTVAAALTAFTALVMAVCKALHDAAV